MNVEMDTKMEFGGINTPGKSRTWVCLLEVFSTNRVNKQNIILLLKIMLFQIL